MIKDVLRAMGEMSRVVRDQKTVYITRMIRP